MDIQQLSELPLEERQLHLKAMAYRVEEGTYFKKYTPEELDAYKDAYTDLQIELGDAEDRFKEETKAARERLKQLRERNRTVLTNIRQRGEYADGITYLVDDQVAGKMFTLDEAGNILNERRLRPDEKQQGVFNQSTTLKKVSNGE